MSVFVTINKRNTNPYYLNENFNVYDTVPTYSDLPLPAIDYNGLTIYVEKWSVLTPTKLSGFYLSDGGSWVRRSDKVIYSQNSFTASNKIITSNNSGREITDTSIEVDGPDLNLVNGGLKDTNVSTAIKLGSATDTSLLTVKKDIVGGINEAFGIADTATSDLASHESNITNPHSVTKAQVGLSNVQNIDTSNASNISSGFLSNERIEKVGVDKLWDLGSGADIQDTLLSANVTKAGNTFNGSNQLAKLQSNGILPPNLIELPAQYPSNFNGNNQLIQATFDGKYPALDGSLITNLGGGPTLIYSGNLMGGNSTTLTVPSGSLFFIVTIKFFANYGIFFMPVFTNTLAVTSSPADGMPSGTSDNLYGAELTYSTSTNSFSLVEIGYKNTSSTSSNWNDRNGNSSYYVESVHVI